MVMMTKQRFHRDGDDDDAAADDNDDEKLDGGRIKVMMVATAQIIR